MIFKLETPEHQRTAIRNVAETLFYPSFGAPLVLLWAPCNSFGLHSKLLRRSFSQSACRPKEGHSIIVV